MDMGTGPILQLDCERNLGQQICIYSTVCKFKTCNVKHELVSSSLGNQIEIEFDECSLPLAVTIWFRTTAIALPKKEFDSNKLDRR